ncbi:hypothetical protein [Sporosarcina sp. FSL K6-1508]|uniref:hypothetical protein n=1 Tax=Sporosarcina sp. FSL K6-1508 TaxID=2921553 RepID=UPI0030FA318F
MKFYDYHIEDSFGKNIVIEKVLSSNEAVILPPVFSISLFAIARPNPVVFLLGRQGGNYTSVF